jgi:hypothetical protein
VGREVRVLARATAASAVVVGLFAATALASGQSAPGLTRVRVDRLALSLRGQPRDVSVRSRALVIGDGLVYELVGSGRGDALDKVTGARVCYDLLYVFDCDSQRSVMLHARFQLAGRSVSSFLTSSSGYALLYRYRPDHTYSFLLQKRRQDLVPVQTCVFAPPIPCVGPARRTVPDEGSVRLSFSTRGDTTPRGSFTIAVNRIGSAAVPGQVESTAASGARAATVLPGMAPQTPGQALAIIRTVVTRNAEACGMRRWGVEVSGFPARWEAVVTVVRDAGSAAATWMINETRLVPTNRLAAAITTGC